MEEWRSKKNLNHAGSGDKYGDKGDGNGKRRKAGKEGYGIPNKDEAEAISKFWKYYSDFFSVGSYGCHISFGQLQQIC